MAKKGKFDIQESKSELIITFRWFTPIAFFLIFFSLMWNGIISTFFGVLSGQSGVPIVFSLFIIPFFAVGAGLVYYTLCLFLNKTTITIDSNTIKTEVSPLPWWKGSKTLETSEVKQLYVKETVNRNSKGSTNYTYALRVLLNDETDIEVVSGSTIHNAEDARFLEKKIEAYLDIEDYQVVGEYGGTAAVKPNFQDIARFIKQKVNPTNITLENLSKGAVLDYKLKTWEVAYAMQYDWSSGQVDNLFQLLSSADNMLLYLKKDMALFTPYVEEKGNYFDIEQLPENTNFGKLPVQFDYKGKTYRKEGSYGGKVFPETVSGVRRGTDLIQSFYLTSDKLHSVRLEQKRDASISVFLGTKAEIYEFSNILPS